MLEADIRYSELACPYRQPRMQASDGRHRHPSPSHLPPSKEDSGRQQAEKLCLVIMCHSEAPSDGRRRKALPHTWLSQGRLHSVLGTPPLWGNCLARTSRSWRARVVAGAPSIPPTTSKEGTICVGCLQASYQPCRHAELIQLTLFL